MFGFSKRKVLPVSETDTALDRAIKTKKDEIYETRVSLREKTIAVIVANEAIKCYPEGADKRKAEKDAEARKNGLLALIGHYDCLMRDYNELLNKVERVEDGCVRNVRNTTKDWHNKFSKSHELVEIEVRNFYRGK